MKRSTVRLPTPLVAEIEAESRRGSQGQRGRRRDATISAIADLVGSVTALPTDLARHRKAYLKKTGYGRKRAR